MFFVTNKKQETTDFQKIFDCAAAPQRAADWVRELAAGAPAPAAGRGLLGNGGATFPPGGGPAPAAEASEENTKKKQRDFSSALGRWGLLHKIQRLCAPADVLGRGPSVCGCGVPADGPAATGSVSIHKRPLADGRTQASASGLYRCWSPWLCPVCAPRKAVERQERVARVVSAAHDKGMLVVAIALTAHHTATQSLADVKTLIDDASRSARSGRDWKEIQKIHGIAGVIVGKEVTISRKNGWHYHQHLLVIVDPPEAVVDAVVQSDGDENAAIWKVAHDAGQAVADRYAEMIRAAGGWLSKEHGTKIRVCDNPTIAGEYAAKGSAAWETAGGPTKAKTRNDAGQSLTPWDLAELAFSGDEWARKKWSEYVEEMPGTVSCRVSWQLAKKLSIEPEDDSESGGEEVTAETDHVVGYVEVPTWRRWLHRGLISTFLQRIELYEAEDFDRAVYETESDADRIDAWRARRADEAARARETARTAQEAADAELIAKSRTLWSYRIARELVDSGCGGRRQIAEAIERLPDHAISPEPEDVVAALAKIGRTLNPANDDPQPQDEINNAA